MRSVTSNIVILEVVFVLTKLYRFKRAQVSDAVTKLLQMRSLTVIEKTDSKNALTLWQDSNKSYGDCGIVAQLPPQVMLATFDHDLAHFDSVQVYQWDK